MSVLVLDFEKGCLFPSWLATREDRWGAVLRGISRIRAQSEARHPLTPLRASYHLAGALPMRGFSRDQAHLRGEREGGQSATEKRNEAWLTLVHMKPKESNDGNGKEGAKG